MWKLADLLPTEQRIVVHHNCPTGKVPFNSRDDAERSRRRQSGHHTEMKAFRCGWCDKFHLGHRRGNVV